MTDYIAQINKLTERCIDGFRKASEGASNDVALGLYPEAIQKLDIAKKFIECADDNEYRKKLFEELFEKNLKD